MTPQCGDIAKRLHALEMELEEREHTYFEACEDWVYKENAYRMAQAKAMVRQREGTVDVKKALVDQACEKERIACHLAKVLMDSGKEAMINTRAKLSAQQSLVKIIESEASTTYRRT